MFAPFFVAGLLRAGEVSLRYLDAAHPSITERVEAGAEGVKSARFVRVDVVEVTNPKELALAFDVVFKPDNDAAIWLGTFGPYPADNPGQFIVPTKGVVRPGGSIVVSMQIPRDVPAPDRGSIRVAVGRISLRP